MGFKNFLRDYFTFNRRERRGVFILLSIILLLILYLSFSDLFFPKEQTDFSMFEKEISAFEEAQKQITDSISKERSYFSDFSIHEADSAERFSFNPNHLPDEDWRRLGLSNNQIKTIKNYESKGGKFRTKADVKKMYCITPEFYASIEPYIQIPDEKKSFKKNEPPTSNFKPQTAVVELNSADTTELKKLKGIGSAFAKRIVKFRDLLGGFVKKEQLLDVYGFDKEKYDLVSPQVKIDLSKVKKININSASVDDLNKHPYIDKKIALKIFMQRVNKGNYSDVQEILKLNFADEELFAKIAPYLTIE